MTEISKGDRVGLALGGGAILGAAHIGVLRALDEAGIEICAISGTSIGAMIAALHAFGKSSDEIADIARELDWLDMSSLSVSRYGLLSNEKMGRQFEKAVGDVRIEDAETPLAIIATDIGSSDKIVLTKGSAAQAIIASSCVPGIVAPVEVDGRMLVDGGLVENVPISPLRGMGAEKVIAVDLNAKREYRKPDGLLDVLLNSLDIALDNATRIITDEADLLITPELNAYSRINTTAVNDLIGEGYRAACEALGRPARNSDTDRDGATGRVTSEETKPQEGAAAAKETADRQPQPFPQAFSGSFPRWLERKVPPVLVTLAFAALMWGVAQMGTVFNFPDWLRIGGGVLLLLAGFVLGLLSLRAFHDAGTGFDPLRPDKTSVLVTTGVFRLSRNPMYLALLLALLAWALFLSSLVSLALAAGFVVWMNRLQIRAEERALRENFGDEYADYEDRVRRWLGRTGKG
ncbi:MAG: patatin-like phospholipase family protein [Xanthomonadales bacterium]|nr:patatin-like phospholipase family protein [Xanthomonadales bacterium]